MEMFNYENWDICERCGCMVYSNYADKHTEEHEKFDELVEWAQYTDKKLYPAKEYESGCDCVNAPEGMPDCKYCNYMEVPD